MSGAGEVWLTVDQAAVYCKLSASRLYQLRYRGGGPRAFKLGWGIYYKTPDLDEWLATRRVRRGRRPKFSGGQARLISTFSDLWRRAGA